MAKPRISAKEVVQDIRAGLTDSTLMEKYNLSPKGLHSLFMKLLDSGAITRQDLVFKAPNPQPAAAPAGRGPVEETPFVPRSPQPGPSATLKVPGLSKKDGTWEVAMGEDTLTFFPSAAGDPMEVPRWEVDERLHVMPLWGGQAVLEVRDRKTKLKLKLDPAARARIEAWLGPLTESRVRAALANRFAYCMPVAIFIGLSSLAAADYLGVVMGTALGGLWILAKYWPRKELFLLDALWFAALTARVSFNVITGDSPFWLILVPVLLFAGLFGVLYYLDFREKETADGTV
ncbi:MAG: hypothetical protein AB1646_05730 [Thermodesulfobacteriota bacterium]